VRTLSAVVLVDYVAAVTIASLEYLTAVAVSVASLCRWITSLPLPLSLSWIIGLYLCRYRRLSTPFSPKKTLTRTKLVTGVKSAGRRLLVLPPPHFLEWVV